MKLPANNKTRSSQVQTQDLTESRLNDDFVFWLKKNGMNTLLVVLMAACAFLGYNYWQRKNVDKTAAAWSDMMNATLPEALEQVAKDHANVPRAAMMSLIAAGDLRLRQLQSGVLSAAEGTTAAVVLDDAARKIAQDAADEDYTNAAKIAVTLAGGSQEKAALVVLQSLFGRAAVAESRGNLDASRALLAEAQSVAGEDWAPIAKLAKARVDGLIAIAELTTLPKNADLPAPTPSASTTNPGDSTGGGDTLFENLIKEQQKQEPSSAPAAPKSGG